MEEQFSEETQWRVVAGTCSTPGAEGVIAYGVECRRNGMVVWRWEDVDVEPTVVRRLADLLNAAQPEPCHYADMVMDFIQRVAGGDF